MPGASKAAERPGRTQDCRRDWGHTEAVAWASVSPTWKMSVEQDTKTDYSSGAVDAATEKQSNRFKYSDFCCMKSCLENTSVHSIQRGEMVVMLCVFIVVVFF